MKTAFLALFFFLFAVVAAVDMVLDTDGRPVINNGSQYYIIPVFRGMGGGLTLARVGKDKCPLTVVQASSERSNGLPVRISSSWQEIKIIKTDMSVGIEFTAVSTCSPKPLMWHIPLDSWSLKIGVDKNKRIEDHFTIERVFEYAYKLTHCFPSPSSCLDLGINVDRKGNRVFLRTGTSPLIFRFKKAN